MANETFDILFVDDDPDFAAGCVRWFQKNGHQVTHTSSGQDGIGQCEKRDFDIAVLDWNLPGLGGLKFVQRMRDVNPENEIIDFTGEGTIENAVESMRRGVIDFLPKPFPMAELERRNIRQLINSIKLAQILSDDVITIEDLPDEFEPQANAGSPESADSKGSLMALLRDYIMEVLEKENGNKSAAARILGVERRKLYRIMKQHRIEG